MIVVGILGATDGSGVSALEIARRSTGTGARTEIVGVAPADDSGDRLLLELAAAGIGHATVTRSVATTIEPADLDLALRYLPDVRAIVLVRPDPGLAGVAVAAAGWFGAALVVVGPLETGAAAVFGVAAPPPIVLDPPARDPDGAFAGLVAALAARLDAGEHPA